VTGVQEVCSSDLGNRNSASGSAFTLGNGLNALNNVCVLGKYNSAYNGESAAFVIGDGYLYNDGGWKTARHDLMLVTKDGEITMFSSTADTTGTGILSSIRAISAAATGGGVDSATVSAIASSYVESGVSGKADSSALSSYVPYSSLEYNTASAISCINGSALAAGSTYSAGDGIDITDDVISVEAPVDIVAGPGIVIDNPDGNTLRVSQYDPTVDVVRDCENWNGHTMKCIILRGSYTTNTTMQNQYIENVLPVGTTIAFIDGSNSYVVYGGNPQINMTVPYCIDYNRLFSPWVDITNRRVNLRYIDVSNNITCTYYLCVKYAVD
jgi:hypothetical protein